MAVLAIFGMFAAICMIPVMGHWILGPIDRAGKEMRLPTRFRIIDFFALIVEIQIVLGLVFGLSPRDGRQANLFLAGLLVGIVAVMWFLGVCTLSHAGIEDPRRRTVFNWFVLPFTYTCVIGGMPLMVVVVGALFDRYRPAPSWWMWLLLMALVVALIGCKKAANWVVAGAPRTADHAVAPQTPATTSKVQS